MDMSNSVEVSGKRLTDSDGAPIERIVGFETEYGWNCDVEGLGLMSRQEAVEDMITKKATAWREQFKETGERIYNDCEHPEYSTAEDISFLGATYRLLSGHVKMARLWREATVEVSELCENPKGPLYGMKIVKPHLIANTCDFLGNSWGSHENLLTPRGLKPPDFINPLAVHHLSRIVWSGAGHVKPARDGVLRFCLSEKADHIWDVASLDTTQKRPLVNLRDEPLADPSLYRRIHIIAGESVMSPFVNALRLAAGSIVLRACELGVRFDDLMPDNPIRAIRDISEDPSLKATVVLENGERLRGLDIQREIAERAISSAVSHDYLTDQEKEWGEVWIKLCDDLADDPELCAKKLDWMVKRNLIDRELAAKKSSGESDAAVAAHKSMDYHRLLPYEGPGMKLLRKGFFDKSPEEGVLENGLPLSETRAKVRGEAIRVLSQIEDDDFYYGADWETLVMVGKEKFQLPDPYSANLDAVAEYLEDAKINAA